MLENIHSPADLKHLSVEQLKELAREMRDTVVKQVAAKGGHLASSLGALDLTVALHKVYDAPKDKIVWDTGHQAYPHKILTGRRDGLATMLSGSFGGTGVTTYAENMGVMAVTRIYSTLVFAIAGVVAILFGLSPKFGLNWTFLSELQVFVSR